MSDFVKVSSLIYAGKSNDTKPKGVDARTECWETDTSAKWITYDGWNWNLKGYDGPNCLSKVSTTPLTTGTLFNFKGSIVINNIIGTVISAIQAQATTVVLTLVCDSLAAVTIGASKDINNFTAGSLLSITGTTAAAIISVTSVGVIGPGQASSIVATCITSGIIKVTYGAASTGSIRWDCEWYPIATGSLVYV